MSKITQKKIQRYSESFNKSSKNILARNAITSSNINDIMTDNSKLKYQNEVFSDAINIKVNISDQGNSGRCWIFSLLNLIRLKMIEKYDLDENFEFSQNYIQFWNKLESANNFLNNIIETKNHSLESRLICSLLSEPISEGGHWGMLVNIVEKYGIIPKYQMNETIHSSNSSEVGDYLNSLLRYNAFILRNLSDSELKKKDEYIDQMMEQIYKILVIFLGEPPSKISWKYYEEGNLEKKDNKNNNKKYKCIADITPLDFYKKYVPYDLTTKLCLINYPCKAKPFYKKYSVEYSTNRIDGFPVEYINVPIAVMKDCVKKSIKKKEALWFGSDVGKYSSSDLGILDPKTINYKHIFDIEMKIDKCSKLEYKDGQVSHAMVIKGFNQDKKQKYPDKYLVENSWGETTGENGNFVMSNEWFDDNVYMLVIDKNLISKDILYKANKSETIKLPFWSPFGKLLR